MKTTSRSQWILVAAACLVVASCGGPSAADRPPGVDANSWIRISDVAGLMLTDVDAAFPVVGRAPSEPNERMAFPMPRQGTGVLMVKLQGVWTRIDLELPSPRVQPLL